MGGDIASKTAPSRISSFKEKGQQVNVLFVDVDNAAYGMKLSYQQDMIAEKIAVYFGYKAVHKIRTRVVS